MEPPLSERPLLGERAINEMEPSLDSLTPSQLSRKCLVYIKLHQSYSFWIYFGFWEHWKYKGYSVGISACRTSVGSCAGHDLSLGRDNSLSMSRLDRFLLSDEWCLTWLNCIQVGQLRGLSDHCPLIMSVGEENWGPQAFTYAEMLERYSWIDSLKVRLEALEGKGEETILSDADLGDLHGIASDIHSLSRLHACISWKSSRSIWLKEGDANSKYFHSIIASCGRDNIFTTIQVDGITMKGVQPICQAVSHFASHFKASIVERPKVDNLQFKRLTN
ncbi:hypothetical protein TSUD_124980 [Trifolium subterraneum]|uniref:Endonuclease/exonuclease/phosphatase domain-containing protein n=1 Tax=Trifolium subterraneum TaxID=3900 RepID=A0A2Z6MR09_TRISU|nr:hypothetical protein TSUD_124980 [Trifolium subterraneum]